MYVSSYYYIYSVYVCPHYSDIYEYKRVLSSTVAAGERRANTPVLELDICLASDMCLASASYYTTHI
jgi:hypothetical protein